ncbi:MAG: amidohydrolase family protein [Chloroflexota bacterium]
MTTEITIVNGRIFGNPGATALRVEAGRIAQIGADADMPRGGDVIDARGGLVIPGLDDAHIHLRYGARQLADADLFGLQTADETLDAIAEHARANPHKAWVRGRGWVYSAFEGGLPHRRLLDAIVPDRPAWIRCYDGHTAWANTAALHVAGITRDTPDPATGVIVRDEDGEATGAFKEDAMELVDAVIPEPTEADDRASVADAIARFHRDGITAAQDAMGDLANFAFFGRLADEGALPLRVCTALDLAHGISFAEWQDRLDAYEAASFRGAAARSSAADPEVLRRWRHRGEDRGDARPLRGRRGHGAAELDRRDPEPPRGRGRSPGLADRDPRDRRSRRAHDPRRVRGGRARQRPVAGDPRGERSAPGQHARRHRVEHIETIDAADIERFARLGVVASMQPFHADPSPNQIDLWAANIGPDRVARLGLGLARARWRPARLRQRLAGGAVEPVDRHPQRRGAADALWRARGRLAARRAPHGCGRHRRLHRRCRVRRVRGPQAGAPGRRP